MSNTDNRGPSINVNLFIQNNIKIGPSGFDKAKQNPYPTYNHPSNFEFKESAKYYPTFETEDLRQAKKLQNITQGSILDECLSHSECSSTVETNTVKALENLSFDSRNEVAENENLTELLGYTLIFAALALFVFAFFAYFGSFILGKTGHVFLDWIMEENYYCYLIPLMVPITFILLYCNWLAIKFFRHS